jgi:hypothetical protein
MTTIVPVNGSDRDWTKYRFVLWFGACAPTHLMVWGNGLDDALDEAVDWIAEHAPGLLADEAVQDEYKRLVAEGKSEEEAQTEATVDTTPAGNACHYLHSWEWGITFENPTRAQILDLQGR